MFINFECDDQKQLKSIPISNCSKTIVRKRFGKSYFTHLYKIYGMDKSGKLYSKIVSKDEYESYMF
jgi:hypothetical protein